MSDRRFRFAVQHERSPSGPPWIESARRIESLAAIKLMTRSESIEIARVDVARL